ncbi:FAS1 domain-containing protein [Mariannaea sp. PMI_226]|nr:FAS1 domain-containing protein [Mariannaea sp. PMI_226]
MRIPTSLRCLAASLTLAGLASAQSADELSTALEKYDDLSTFRSLLSTSHGIFQTIVSEKRTNITVLVPTNEAITTYLTRSGVSAITDIGSQAIETLFSYHVMAASLKSKDFDNDRGLAVPTLLKEDAYNNRSAGAGLKQQFGGDGTGQVVFASGSKASSKREFKGPTVMVQGGMAQQAQMTVVDGVWGPKNVNSFQVVDTILIPPTPCSVTIRSTNSTLRALDYALNKTDLYPTLDTTRNVTCLGPSTTGFNNSGNPQLSLSKGDLLGALLHHTLKEVTYTNFLEDGMVLQTFNDTTVRVRIKGDDIYFNNAKVIEANVLTNNGLIHILDRVMGPDTEEANGTSTAQANAATSTSSSTSSTSSSDSNAASSLSVSVPGVMLLLAGLAMM